jgi:hypothetical protein
VRGRFRQHRSNRLKHTVNIAHYFIIPKAQHTVVAVPQPLVAHTIGFTIRMLPTIQLDDQSRITANEVDCKSSNRFLPDELEITKSTVTNAIPKAIFCVC